jgi:hypothetical protein
MMPSFAGRPAFPPLDSRMASFTASASRRPARLRGAGVVALLAIAGLVAGAAVAAEPPGFRRLAPGVLTVIPADKSTDDVLQRGDLLEVTKGQADLAWTPKMAPANTTFVERARGREYPRDIWCLEFAFKAPRLLDVDVPAGESRMQRKRIWYLVYRVKNVGGRRVLMGEGEGGVADPAKRRVETFEKPVRFVPQFVLESLEPVEDSEGLSSYRAYLDRLVPSAMDEIRAREDAKRQFLDSVEMSAAEIAPGEERWGVAIWEDVDPRIDFFSIYVRGLSNAVRWRQRPGSVIKADDPPGSDMEETLEALRLDFWRPGDQREAGDREMSVGFAGMFERMALGGRLMAAIGWPGHVKARPVEGLDALGLRWSDLVEPDAGGGPASLLPLDVVLRKAADLPPPGDPIAALRAVFGDLGVVAIEELAAAAAGPVDPVRDEQRRKSLKAVGLTPEDVGRKPLASLAKVIRALEEKPDLAARRAAAVAVFGPAARRVEWLAEAVAKARAVATMRAIDVDRNAVVGGDALVAFDAFRPAIDGLDDQDRARILDSLSSDDPRRGRLQGLGDEPRREALENLVLQGVFGARGPELYAAAVAMNEGIDHAWVFRYEDEVGSP